MMGRKYREQANFFYEFRLDDMIPKGHLLRRINVFVTSVLGDLHEQLGPFYSARTRSRSSSDASLVQRSASFADRSSTARWVAASRPSDATASLTSAPDARLGVRRDYVAVLVRLSYLSPEIVGAILVGQQPIELTPTRLVMLSRDLPHDWRDQRRLLGFAPA